MSYHKENTPLTAGSQAASSSTASYQTPPYAPPSSVNHQQQQQARAAAPSYVGPTPTSTTTYPTIFTPGGFGAPPPSDPEAEEKYIERQLKYLGPISQVSDAYRLDTTTLKIEFDDSFPEVSKPGPALESVRKLNRILYEGMSDAIHIIFSLFLGFLAAITVGFFMGMARFMYTYMAGPFNQLMFLLIASLAPSWRAFFRAGMDPIFESGSLALSNIQVRLGMEGKARHKELKD
ncbi:hypothetical protein PTSG_03919 [Salpingoeca rosetta]|uniref:Caveolin n=1 Tax=Salpingoeca rosetta (strain ATCC 50818 / BSB-021) TaxID=946362 RepID=F2U793_SALR5|nr:uncharacterized protein PTSG_03919 [Salpingoeca rosetta]EGD83310.1 hypothetical protein PTSG_03919 [Salpingoeca rosetta]|eukprot:XP_004994814.1 hypothetical protein PTSG_03919 [Salpingoeca rosetta]